MARYLETVLSVRAEAMQDKAQPSVVEDNGFVCKRHLKSKDRERNQREQKGDCMRPIFQTWVQCYTDCFPLSTQKQPVPTFMRRTEHLSCFAALGATDESSFASVELPQLLGRYQQTLNLRQAFRSLKPSHLNTVEGHSS